MYLVSPASKVPEGFDAAIQVYEESMEEGFPRVHGLQGLDGTEP